MPENLISLDIAELYACGCNFWLGFDGDEDRLIYTLDFENSFIKNVKFRGTHLDAAIATCSGDRGNPGRVLKY